MAVKSGPDLGVNSWLEDELYQQYLHDHGAVDDSWKELFENGGGNGAATTADQSPQTPAESAPSTPAENRLGMETPAPAAGLPPEKGAPVEIVPLPRAAARIPDDIVDSGTTPTA